MVKFFFLRLFPIKMLIQVEVGLRLQPHKHHEHQEVPTELTLLEIKNEKLAIDVLIMEEKLHIKK